MSDLSVRVISKSDAKELHELAYAVITTENVSVCACARPLYLGSDDCCKCGRPAARLAARTYRLAAALVEGLESDLGWQSVRRLATIRK